MAGMSKVAVRVLDEAGVALGGAIKNVMATKFRFVDDVVEYGKAGAKGADDTVPFGASESVVGLQATNGVISRTFLRVSKQGFESVDGVMNVAMLRSKEVLHAWGYTGAKLDKAHEAMTRILYSKQFRILNVNEDTGTYLFQAGTEQMQMRLVERHTLELIGEATPVKRQGLVFLRWWFEVLAKDAEAGGVVAKLLQNAG